MAGQLIRRGERTWLVRVYLGSDSQTGKRRYLNKTVHGTKKDAQGWLNDALKRRDLGEEIGQSTMLCSEFFEKWLDSAVRQRVRESSLESYSYVIRRYVLTTLGGRRLSAVRAIDLQHLYANLQARGLTNRTVGYIHTLVRNAFKQAVRWGMLRTSPAQFVDPPRQTRKEMQSLTAEEVRALLAAVTEDRYRLLIATAISTGARPGEYLGLRWKDVDWQAGSVTIQRSLTWKRKSPDWCFSEPKTARSRRTVPLPPGIMKSLREHRRRQAEDRLQAGADWQNLDLVFTRFDGSPVRLWELRDNFEAALKAAGLRHVRLYDLRHSCATILMAEGLHPKVVSERLGHASIAITLGTYSHVLPGMQEQATEKLEKAIFD